MDYKSELKARIPEGILQFCEVAVVNSHFEVVRWTTVAPREHLFTILGVPQGLASSSLVLRAVLSDMDASTREARVSLIFQNLNLEPASESLAYPRSFDTLRDRMRTETPRLPFYEAHLEPDRSGTEYWRRCRRHIGHDPLFGPAAGAFVTDGADRYLLQRRGDDGTWGILGGGVEVGESIVETAQREVWEESGLQVKIESLLSVATGDDCSGQYPNGDQGQFWGFLFLASVIGGTLIESNEETLELGWFTYDQIADLANKSLYLEHNYRNLRNQSPQVHDLVLSHRRGRP